MIGSTEIIMNRVKCGTKHFVRSLSALLASLTITHCQRPVHGAEITFDSAELTDRALSLANKGEIDAAAERMAEAIRRDPSDPALHYNLGKLCLKKGDIEQAIKGFSQAIRLDPDEALAYDMRGLAYFRNGNFKNALADFTEAICLDPRSARAYNNRGRTYSKFNDTAHALADLTEAHRLDPKAAQPLENRARVYIKAAKWRDAIDDLRALTLLAQNEVAGYNGLAWILATCPDATLRNGQEAMVLARKACGITQWMNWYCLGTLAAACAEAGDFRGAVEYQEKCLSFADIPPKERYMAEERLISYKDRKPYHESGKVSSDDIVPLNSKSPVPYPPVSP